ncbi:aminodeoxychorismate/anthranilate synthase component II [bacterium]|nr:aminodeoxychorismate/anthranilate synthase component II [bacterium]
MIFVLDNYDSFVYNLVQYLGVLGQELKVFRNDAITVEAVGEMHPSVILISPGPCTPNEAGISKDLISAYADSIPILGVCLGHQCIGEVFGGKVIRAGQVVHGKVSEIHHDGKTIFEGIGNPFTATRYHSLIVERRSLPDCLEISAETKTGEIMALRHKIHPVEGVQFHPESVLTEPGMNILKNFLKRAKVKI